MTQFNTLVEEMKRKAVLGKDNHNGVYWFGEKELDMLITTIATRVREETIEEAVRYIEDARQEHNDARHGTSTDDAYDRACDAVNLLSTLNK